MFAPRKVGVIGYTGAGKTTFIAVIYGLLNPEYSERVIPRDRSTLQILQRKNLRIDYGATTSETKGYLEEKLFSLLNREAMKLTAMGEVGLVQLGLRLGRKKYNVNIIDGTGAPIKEKMSLLIKNNIIEDICPQGTLNLPPSVQNTQVQDLQGKYLLPGFIDVHIHLSFMEKIEDWLGFTDAYGTLHALNHMRNYLKVGVMSYRDVGGPVNTMIALKTAIATKKIICGRLFPCGPIITTSAGHGAEMEQTSSVNIADTPDQFRILIRKLYNKGIRHIKISPFYRLEDVKAAVDECKILDIPITSHGGGVKDTHPPTMVKIAVEGGVNCIEHIPLIGPDVLDLMKEKGTFLVPTLSVYKRLYDLEFPPILLERGWSIETQENFFKEALKLGIPIGIGTDYVESLQTHYPQCYFEEIRSGRRGAGE